MYFEKESYEESNRLARGHKSISREDMHLGGVCRAKGHQPGDTSVSPPQREESKIGDLLSCLCCSAEEFFRRSGDRVFLRSALKYQRLKMLPSPSGTIWVYHEAVDLRKSYNSLCAVVEENLGRTARNGEGYVFINRSRNLAKVLWWDRTAWCLMLKKLSSGKFRVSGRKDVRELEISQIRMFFDGI